jgi:hypothetical protein
MVRVIDRDDWSTFFESFPLQHDHWLVHVDDEKASLPLEGIVVRESRIDIHLGADIRHHRRIVIDAERVIVEQTGGEQEALAIVATDGHTTRLRFRRG